MHPGGCTVSLQQLRPAQTGRLSVVWGGRRPAGLVMLTGARLTGGASHVAAQLLQQLQLQSSCDNINITSNNHNKKHDSNVNQAVGSTPQNDNTNGGCQHWLTWLLARAEPSNCTACCPRPLTCIVPAWH